MALGVMTTELIVTVFAAGAGGFALNIMNLWEDSRLPKSKRAPKDGLYWLFFILWPLIGVGLGFLYFLDGSVLRPMASFTLGLGAPATLKALMNTATTPVAPPENSEQDEG